MAKPKTRKQRKARFGWTLTNRGLVRSNHRVLSSWEYVVLWSLAQYGIRRIIEDAQKALEAKKAAEDPVAALRAVLAKRMAQRQSAASR